MFDNIAADWQRKRAKPWVPFTSMFIKWYEFWQKNYGNQTPSQNLITLDLGSGTGRHSQFFKKYSQIVIDLDISRKMLELNRTSTARIQADLNALPIRKNLIDIATSVATVHHIKGNSQRRATMDEILRVTKKDSLIIITVWRFFQAKFKSEFLKEIKKCPPESSYEIGDINIPWKISQGRTSIPINRYYHLFRANEFYSFFRIYCAIKLGSFGNDTQFGEKVIKNKKTTNFYAVLINNKN